MKTTMLSLVTAITTGTAVLGASPAYAAHPRPAVATTSTVRPALDPGTYIAIIKGAYDIFKSFLGGGQSGQAATAQIIAAINSAKTDIINHIDAIATVPAKTCAEEAVVDFPDFEALTPDNKQNFALNATSCVILIDNLLTTVTDKASLDQLGFALNAVGPIALIVRSRTGLTNSGLIPMLVHANQQVSSVMAPACRSVTVERRIEWVCSSYNGDTWGPDPFVVSQNHAGARTSWAVAQAVLPTLTTL